MFFFLPLSTTDAGACGLLVAREERGGLPAVFARGFQGDHDPKPGKKHTFNAVLCHFE